MHPILTSIQQQLDNVIEQIELHIPNDDPLSIAHNSWAFPGITKTELIDEAQNLRDMIANIMSDDLGKNESNITDYVRRLQYLSKHTVSQLWDNGNQAVPAYLITLQSLKKALEPLESESNKEHIVKLRNIRSKIRSIEAQIDGLKPRTASLSEMVERIENAYDSAEQLPSDLASLEEARIRISSLLRDATQENERIRSIKEKAENIDAQLAINAEDAKKILERCETAYSAATSVGLAAAFSERSAKLSTSMWVWVGGLAIALAAGAVAASERINTLMAIFKDPHASSSIVVPNLLISLLSVGAPIWFSWLSTKQIGQRFRLSEDYAFKASIARAYEGFRREAARVDQELEARLLASALARLDELPLRLVETESHGSPWHELAQSQIVKQAIKIGPTFVADVKDLAEKTVGGLVSKKGRRVAKPQPEEE